MIRYPMQTLESMRDVLMDVIRFLRDMPTIAVVSIEIVAVASSDVDALISSTKLKTLYGAVQIGGTTTDVPTIAYHDNTTVQATYSFGASTTGKQTYRFLLIGV